MKIKKKTVKAENNTRKIFDSISGKYEKTNFFISLGLEKYWRFIFNRLIAGNEKRILDACCGTGNSTFAIWKKIRKNTTGDYDIKGIDFSQEMLEIAREKSKTLFQKKNQESRKEQRKPGNKSKIKKGGNIDFINADILNIPFKDSYFDLITLIFGIRNIDKKKEALSELHRVCRSGGQILLMEFNMPRQKFIKKIYRIYLSKILVNIGAFITKNRQAYNHLSQTIQDFPEVEEFKKIMELGGWKNVKTIAMSCNTCIIYKGIKAS